MRLRYHGEATQNVHIFNEITGERTADKGVGFMDINPKTGEMFGQGYGVMTYKDGDMTVRTWEGGPVAQGQWKGTWTFKREPENIKMPKEAELGLLIA